MTTQEEPGTDLIPHPATGEAVKLSGPTDELGLALNDVRKLEADLRSFKRVLTDEVLARMDEETTWTAHLGSMTLTAPRPGGEEWDAKQLEQGLKALVERGSVKRGALDNTIAYEPKVKKRGVAGLKAIAEAGNAEVAELLARCRKPPKSRSITIDLGAEA